MTQVIICGRERPDASLDEDDDLHICWDDFYIILSSAELKPNDRFLFFKQPGKEGCFGASAYKYLVEALNHPNKEPAL